MKLPCISLPFSFSLYQPLWPCLEWLLAVCTLVHTILRHGGIAGQKSKGWLVCELGCSLKWAGMHHCEVPGKLFGCVGGLAGATPYVFVCLSLVAEMRGQLLGAHCC